MTFHAATIRLLEKEPAGSLNIRERRFDRDCGPEQLKAAEAKGLVLPASVREWYALKDAVRLLHAYGNMERPTSPEEMELDRSGATPAVVFLVENQGVCWWAFALDGSDDPPVLVQFDSGGPWKSCGCTFSTFVHCQVFDWANEWSEDQRELLGQEPDDEALAYLRERFTEGPSNQLRGEDFVARRFFSKRARVTIRESWHWPEQVDWLVATSTFDVMDELLEELSPFYDEEQ